jgi:hypothetical protein
MQRPILSSNCFASASLVRCILDASHFALDAAADQIAALVQGFVGFSREGVRGAEEG